MEEQEKKEFVKTLIKKEKELGNEDFTEEEVREDLEECLNTIGEESFNKILNLDWQRRDNVLRVLELLSKD